MKFNIGLVVALVCLTLGCGSQEIQQAQRGQKFSKTGMWAFYAGGSGFIGPVLGPGTHYTGVYDEIKMVDCTQKMQKEPLQALTKDGVQFALDVYIRYGATCTDDNAVKTILAKFSPGFQDPAHPDWVHTIFGVQLFDTYLRPALGEAVRVSVSPHIANDINNKREEIFEKVRLRFKELIDKDATKLVTVYDLNLSNLNFPESMNVANTNRAVQAILKDKAIAEREKVNAEIETAKSRRLLAEADGDTEAGRIDRIGAALKRNPEYLAFDLQTKLPDIYAKAGEKGNLIIAAPSPSSVMSLPQVSKK